MSRLAVHTAHGPIALVGHVHTGAPRPSLLVISGAFPPVDYKHELLARFPGANVLIGLLPGMYCPAFADPRAEVFAEAYDEVIRLLLPGQPIVAYGVSTGCLVTLSLKSPNIRRHVLQEPFFSTGPLWPFLTFARWHLEKNTSGELHTFLDNVFGITESRVENRDYTQLLDAADAPIDVLVGEVPLEVDRASPWPSFTSAEDRRRLVEHPHTRIFEGPRGSGHHLEATNEGADLVTRVLLSALHAVIPPPPPE